MLTDVIAAIATAPGKSAVALVRLSGTGAHEVAARVLDPFRADVPRTARLARARRGPGGEVLDRVMYSVFVGPASYTGEDMVEIGTHGGMLAPTEVLGALYGAGARAATAGEFTRRALRNGKIDLLQAEATADLVDATAPAQRRAALQQLGRQLSSQIGRLRDRVLALEALVAYEIDFPEEDEGPVAPERVERATADLDAEITALLKTAGEGERLRAGALCVIAGVPNSGKSSLFNTLLGSERAIVTEVEGTTRDAIEAMATVEGFPFRLVDTAGLRDSADRIERLGIEVSRRYLDQAQVIVFCADASRALTAEERAFLAETSVPTVLVRTKIDLGMEPGMEGLAVSSHTGQGIDDVRTRLARAVFEGLVDGGDAAPVITRERHRVALTLALEEVRAFGDQRSAGLEAAVAATHLRAAVTALEDIVGVVSPDDVLERVFSSFCIGK